MSTVWIAIVSLATIAVLVRATRRASRRQETQQHSSLSSHVAPSFGHDRGEQQENELLLYLDAAFSLNDRDKKSVGWTEIHRLTRQVAKRILNLSGEHSLERQLIFGSTAREEEDTEFVRQLTTAIEQRANDGDRYTACLLSLLHHLALILDSSRSSSRMIDDDHWARLPGHVSRFRSTRNTRDGAGA